VEFARAYNPLRALVSAARLVRRSPLTLLAGGTALFFLDVGYSVVLAVDWDFFERLRVFWIVLFVLLAIGALLVCLALWVFECLLGVGFAGAVERALTRGEEDIGDLLRGRGRWVAMVVARLAMYAIHVAVLLPGVLLGTGAYLAGNALQRDGWLGPGLATLVGVVWLVPLVYVLLGLVLTPQAVALEGLGPAQALARAWSLARGQRWRLLVYYLVFVIATSLGFFACCVGVFVTASLAYTALNESYLRLIRSEAEQEAWAVKP
jgi:hypothetical protein